MRQSRFTATEIIYAVRQVELDIPVREIARRYGVSDKTVYLQRRRYAGVSPSELKRLKELTYTRPWYGYRRVTTLLQREGWMVNPKRIHRIYREEELMVRTKRRKRRVA